MRRAIAAAIDRKAVIEGAVDGFGVPIGSHYVPGAFGFVDTTGINPFNPDKARALLAEAGVKTPLELSLILPPVPYARQGGEVIAAQLAKVGIVAKLQNVEWAQWLSGVYGNKNYDLTIISHVEPFDLGNFAKSGYYWNYESAKFNELYDKINNAPRAADRAKYLGEAQRLLANDAVHAFLFQPQWITVANKGIRGLWKDMPIVRKRRRRAVLGVIGSTLVRPSRPWRGRTRRRLPNRSALAGGGHPGRAGACRALGAPPAGQLPVAS